jgi:pSer/pThr/pTyr-binding forkhead associated (FHA) protein
MTQEQTSGAYLVIQKGTVGKRIELWKECTTIGRSVECDIFLEDLAVHRKQASILYTLTGYVLRDDHGSGDSFVNGRPVKEQLLSNGDQLRFGNTYITFFANEGTRPFQLPSSRGRELHIARASAPQDTVVARLDFIQTYGGLRSVEIVEEVTIGRSRECDIFLEDLTVSRLHATIRQLPNGDYELVDNRSATGTFVNGRAVARCLLHNGDVVQIGTTVFTFRLSRA